MDANHPIVIDSDNSDTESGKKMVDLVKTILSGHSTHNNHAGNAEDSAEARLEVVLGWDQNWRQRQPVGVLVVVGMRDPLGGAAGQILGSLSQQLDDALNYFTRPTWRGRQYGQDDEEFLKWITNAGTRRQDRVTLCGIDNLIRILRRRPPIIELERIPVTSARGNGKDVRVNGPKERTLFYQEPAPVGRLDDAAVQSNDVIGLDIEVQELVRQGMVRSVRTFRVWDVEIL